MRLNLCILACTLLLSSIASAQQEQFKEWSFQIPAGWQRTSQADALTLTPVSASAGSVYIKLFPAQALSESLETWLEDRATQDMDGLSVLQAKRVAPVQAGSFRSLQKLIAFQMSDGTKAVRMYIGQSTVPGRGALILFHSDLRQASVYTPVLNSFLPTVHFSNSPASPAQPPTAAAPAVTGGAHLDGWYVGSRQQFVAGPNFTSSFKTVWDYYRFFPDGWVYKGLPPQSDFNSVRCSPAGGDRNCQTYSIQGRSITFGTDKPDSFETVNATEVRIAGHPTWRLRPLQHAPLGTYEAVSGSGMLGTVSLSIKNLTFQPDGTFSSLGSTGVSSVTPNTAASGYHGNAGSGRYKITGFELDLTYNNGTSVKENILAPADNDTDMLVIGNSTYMKKEQRR